MRRSVHRADGSAETRTESAEPHMPQVDDRLAEVARAVAAIDLASHSFWEVMRTAYRTKWVYPDGPIYFEPEDITLNGERFSVAAGFGLSWECACHGMPVPDYREIIIEGRFKGDQPIVETIVIAES